MMRNVNNVNNVNYVNYVSSVSSVSNVSNVSSVIRTLARTVVGLVLVAATGLWCGCAGDYRLGRVSPPPVSPWRPVAGLGTICVVRPQSFGALATGLHFDNGHLVGVTRGAGVYFCYRAQPGWHLVSARTDNDANLWVDLPTGGRAFVRYELRIGPDALVAMTEARARALLPTLDFVRAVPVSPGVRAPLRRPAPAVRRTRAPST